MAWETIFSVTSASNGIFDISSVDFSTHAAHKLFIDDMIVSADGTFPYMKVYNSSGIVSSVGAYHQRLSDLTYGGSQNEFSEVSTVGLFLTDQSAGWSVGNASDESYAAVVHLLNFDSSSSHKSLYRYSSLVIPGNNSVQSQQWAQVRMVEPITGFRIYTTANSILSGKLTLIGFAL